MLPLPASDFIKLTRALLQEEVELFILAVLSNGKIGSGKTNLINACISNIYLHQDKWRIKDFNQVSHLSKYSVR